MSSPSSRATSPKQAPPAYVLAPEYPEYLAPSDDEVPAEDQPLPADASPTADSPGYIADLEPIEDDFEEDPEMDPVNYAADDDDEEEESSDDEKEKKEHMADSTLLVPDSVPSSQETEPFETDESAATPPPPRSPHTIVPFSQTRLLRARISVRPHTPPSLSAEARIAKYAAAPTPPSPPPFPLSPLSSPIPLIPSPPLPLPSPPLLLPSPTRRDAILEADMPPGRGLVLLLHLIGLRSERVMLLLLLGRLDGVNERMIELATTHRQDVEEFYVRHQDAQDDRAKLRAHIYTLQRKRRYFRSMIQAMEARIRTLEAQVRTLQTQHDMMEWQRREAGDMVTRAYRRIHALEARDPAHPDDVEDADSSC
ncbi:hypothetical protein Tco_0832510 [Tanacetum coccineum]